MEEKAASRRTVGLLREAALRRATASWPSSSSAWGRWAASGSPSSDGGFETVVAAALAGLADGRVVNPAQCPYAGAWAAGETDPIDALMAPVSSRRQAGRASLADEATAAWRSSRVGVSSRDDRRRAHRERALRSAHQRASPAIAALEKELAEIDAEIDASVRDARMARQEDCSLRSRRGDHRPSLATAGARRATQQSQPGRPRVDASRPWKGRPDRRRPQASLRPPAARCLPPTPPKAFASARRRGSQNAVDDDEVGERASLDHAELARIGIARAGHRQELAVDRSRHLEDFGRAIPPLERRQDRALMHGHLGIEQDIRAPRRFRRVRGARERPARRHEGVNGDGDRSPSADEECGQ